MANIKIPKAWENPSIRPVEEKSYYNRRQIVKQLGLITGGLLVAPLLPSCKPEPPIEPPAIGFEENTFTFEGMENFYPATLNPAYTLDRELTDEFIATHYNNFYEFIHPEDPNVYNVFKYVQAFDNRDWKIEVSGLAQNTGSFFLGDLIKEIGLEERTYRHRCVETWAMAVPWTGFPLARLIQFFQPHNSATHVRMLSFADAEQMVGVKAQNFYPWPYFEGLRMDEAMNELSFLATGLFGKPLPKQNGAPMRLVVPWKYGFKSIKSIVKLEFVNAEPETFWHQVSPSEASFLSNVDPGTPHPRWSQEFEYMIPDGDLRPTLPYNGYGDYVASLCTSSHDFSPHNDWFFDPSSPWFFL